METFRLIYERYRRDVYRFALFLTGEASAAEDLTSETFVRAWTARDRIRQNTIKAYLLTITRNLHRDHQRSARPFVALQEALEDRAPRADVQAEHRSSLRDIRARLRRVARGDRRALLLYVFKEMSYGEIAASLGNSVAATKSRISRAREALSGGVAAAAGEDGR